MGSLVAGLMLLQWAGAALGLYLVWRYWHGRMAGDHPQCTRCGYDVFGLPDTSRRCPECGASLDEPGAVVMGRRVRRTGAAVATLAATAAVWGALALASAKIDARRREIAGRPAALMQATMGGNLPAIAALLKADPKLAIDRHSNYTPLQWAVACNNRQAVQLLLANGAAADINVTLSNPAPLQLAVERNATAIITLLQQAGADPNQRDNQGQTPLHAAAAQDRTGLAVAALLGGGADASPVDARGRTPLHAAAASGSGKVAMSALIKAGAKVDATDNAGHTPLHLAMDRQDWDGSLALLELGADLAVKDKQGLTPSGYAASKRDDRYWLRDIWGKIVDQKLEAGRLDELAALLKKEPQAVQFSAPYGTLLHKAAQAGNIDLARVLIEAGADANAVEQDGGRPLHLAVFGDKPEMVKLLVAKGADVHARDNLGRTAMHRVIDSGGLLAKVKLLVACGADPTIRDKFGDTAMLYAAAWGPYNRDTVKFLLDKGVPPDVHSLAALGKVDELRAMLDKDPSLTDDADNVLGRSPLHVAAMHGQVEVVRLLLDRGADPRRADGGALKAVGQTPLHFALHFATQQTKPELVELLLNRGAEVNAQDRNGVIPLHYAAIRSSEAVAMLLHRGADVRAVNQQKQTPLHLAAQNANIEAIRLLLSAGADPMARDQEGRTPLDDASYRREQVQAILGPATRATTAPAQ